METSVASSVLPPSPPPLFPLGAVEDGLAQFPVDVVVRLAHPVAELSPAVRLDGALCEVCLEVLGTNPAGVEFGEEFEEALDVGLLAGRGFSRVLRGDGV